MESKVQNQDFFIYLTTPTPLSPNPPLSTNFANFGPIWMKLGVLVKNGMQSSKPEKLF